MYYLLYESFPCYNVIFIEGFFFTSNIHRVLSQMSESHKVWFEGIIAVAEHWDLTQNKTFKYSCSIFKNLFPEHKVTLGPRNAPWLAIYCE